MSSHMHGIRKLCAAFCSWKSLLCAVRGENKTSIWGLQWRKLKVLQVLLPVSLKVLQEMGLVKRIWLWDKGHLHTLRVIWTASSEFGTYHLCEQRRFRRACASAQSHQNLRCSLIQAVSQEEPSDRKPDPWPLWMAGHAQLKFVMTECSKTQVRLKGLK